jgi:hypothetical protein
MTVLWEKDPKLVQVVWDDITDVSAWFGREALENHFEQSPQICVNVGYLIGVDAVHGTQRLLDSYLIAARKGQNGGGKEVWGLIQRIPVGVIREIMHLKENEETDGMGGDARDGGPPHGLYC